MPRRREPGPRFRRRCSGIAIDKTAARTKFREFFDLGGTIMNLSAIRADNFYIFETSGGVIPLREILMMFGLFKNGYNCEYWFGRLGLFSCDILDNLFIIRCVIDYTIYLVDYETIIRVGSSWDLEQFELFYL